MICIICILLLHINFAFESCPGSGRRDATGRKAGQPTTASAVPAQVPRVKGEPRPDSVLWAILATAIGDHPATLGGVRGILGRREAGGMAEPAPLSSGRDRSPGRRA